MAIAIIVALVFLIPWQIHVTRVLLREELKGGKSLSWGELIGYFIIGPIILFPLAWWIATTNILDAHTDANKFARRISSTKQERLEDKLAEKDRRIAELEQTTGM